MAALSDAERLHAEAPYSGKFVAFDSGLFDQIEPNEAWKQLGQRVFAVPSAQDGAESGQCAAAESSASPALPVAWNAPRIVTNPELTPPLPNAVRFVCISDTHNKDAALRLPRGHVLLHAGDFSNVGLPKEVEAFAQWLASQDGFAHKIVIAGNHDLPFDAVGYAGRAARFRHPRGVDPQVVRDSLIKVGHGVQYLEDSGTTVMGVSIWGSPWQPEFYDWAFNETRGRHLRQIWDRIPSRTAAAGGGGAGGGVDVLVTHGPPLGHGDRCDDGKLAGCADLLLAIQQRIRPKYHVFGHIHEGYGATSDGVTTFVNASTCTAMYKPLNAPIVFDVVPGGAASE